MYSPILQGFSPQMQCRIAFCRTTIYVEDLSLAASILFIFHFSPLRAALEKAVVKVYAKSIKSKGEGIHL